MVITYILSFISIVFISIDIYSGMLENKRKMVADKNLNELNYLYENIENNNGGLQNMIKALDLIDIDVVPYTEELETTLRTVKKIANKFQNE